MKHARLLGLFVVLALVAAACIVPSAAATYSVTTESNVVYGQGEVGGGGEFEDLLLDLYIPDVPEGHPMPLMLMIHGGGFTGEPSPKATFA